MTSEDWKEQIGGNPYNEAWHQLRRLCTAIYKVHRSDTIYTQINEKQGQYHSERAS